VHQELLQKNPANEVFGARLVGVYLLQGDLDAAVTEARKWASSDDKTGLGAQQLGRALQAKRNYTEAAAAYRIALARDPKNMLAIQGLAESLADSGQRTAAREFVEAQLKRLPGQTRLRIMYAAALNTEGRLPEARAVIEKLIAENPKLTFAYSGLAATWPPASKDRIAVLERGLQELPADRDLSLLIGTEYVKAGRIDDSVKVYEDLLAVDSTVPQARNNLAAILSEYRTDKASLEKAVQLMEPFAESSDPGLLDTLGWAHFRNGDAKKAATFLERSVAASPAAPVNRFHLGQVYVLLKDPVRARQQLEEAIRLGGADAAEARQAKAILDKLPPA
jgi:cellulose synthase operon protein C